MQFFRPFHRPSAKKIEIFVLQVYAGSPGLRGSLLDNWHINFLFSHIDHQHS